ncbi:MAG: hypothetical protein HUU16_13895 [Candidatus Omnitrophica bacterium]|nr:hypothetical protein [bacterium]NUN97254.1 hypothetical protein [Candidatus Omnitrophota bacterium]
MIQNLERASVALLVFAALALALSGTALAGEEKAAATHLYGNHVCPVSGKPVVSDVSVTYENKEKGVYGRIYLCCPGCVKAAKKDLEGLYKKFYLTDAKTGKAKEPKDLKNEACPMSGEKVDPSAKIEYNGMIIHFCCPGCADGFLEDPEAKMAKLLPDAKEFELKPAEAKKDK